MPTMLQKPPRSSGATPAAPSDWSALIHRIADDALHVLRCEAQILQARATAAIQWQISRAVMLLVAFAILSYGILCVLGSAIFLLHRWLPWWQSFGLVGLTLLIIGIAIGVYARTRSAPPLPSLDLKS